MRQRKWLALLLALMMVVTVTPVAYAEEETATEIMTEPETVAESGGDPAEDMAAEEPVEVSAETQELQLMASISWQPKPTRTVSSASSFPLTLNNGDVLLINGPINFSASAGQSPITLASGASAKIIINGSVTLRGADAGGITGATAAINVPEGAVLTIYSAHDEELSASRSAPKDTLTVTGGNAAAGTAGGDALKDVAVEHGPTYHYQWYSGGGGNGGGGGLSAPAIGAGGAGGSGGGAGGLLSSDHHGNVQGCGGGGGAGGWPNGGGGGGGGAECTKAENKNDNTSQGGAGGAGGAAGHAGSNGSAGTQTGTDGHGWNDAKPGNGGSGGSGVGVNGTAASGGSGGKENEKGDKKYNGGDGGAGGESVALRAWHTTGSLILSTAANLNTYSWGDGGGQGSSSTLTPLVIYDLMDCQINLSQSVYTYTGNAFKPRITSVSYSAASDRDGRSISGSNKTLSGGYSAYSYGENIHCPTGTVTVLGSQNSKRTTVTNDGSVIGIVEKEFTIKKATLTAPITLSTTTPYVGQSITATLGTYTSPTAGSGSLSTLLRASSAKAEGPKVTWSLTGGAGQCTEQNGLNAKFTLSSTATGTIQAYLSDMNDFEDCRVTVQASPRQTQSFTVSLSAETPHPRMEVTVTLPEGIVSPTYQWYADGAAIKGATGAAYVPAAGDIGKKLSVIVTPDAATGYGPSTATAKNAVESHRYSANGFCTVCGEYEPAALTSGAYQIGNGGQMFWFAALINGDKTHAEFSAQEQNAAGSLTADINLENREWKPIASFSGSFEGQSHRITGFRITNTASDLGFFGSSGGTLRGFTLEGEILLSADASNIGGVVGSTRGGTVSRVTSAVRISNTDGACAHVGGVIGGVNNTETVIEQCLFTGSVTIANSTDCIGGIVGYSNGGARISHCANLGTVTAAAQDAYTGGILGYLNNASPSIKNCYSYGTVQNGGGNYCGAIAGRVRNHTPANFTDNYYLTGSAAAAFGSGSQSTSAVMPAREKSAFQSGEVCYLLNGSSSAEDVIWRQDIDNGQTPYDAYPVLEGGIVLRNRAHHDCTANEDIYVYSNSVMEPDHVNHHYVNGFCTCCDVREAAAAENGVYQIANGGQLYWFAEQLNSGAIPQNSSAVITGDIGLEGNRDGSAAGYEGITKDRNFPGIGTTERPYQGTFSGGGHTVSAMFISRWNIKANDIGMFGSVSGASISQMTVNGQINLSAAADKDIQHVGGIVGSASGSRLSGLVSYVGILGNGADIPHIGGVVGEALNGSTVTRCMYFHYIQMQKTVDCVGGVVGYINNSAVSYCANHGTVTTEAADAYVGGVLGYINNADGCVKNCYNYGTVQNGGGDHCGAIVGWLRSHTAANFTDNYYLTGSAPAAFGSGSQSTTASAPAREIAAFVSGEVCYLVNGKASVGSTALWKQDIDNGNTPYDIYPIFDAAPVYYRSDGTYSNEPEKVSVTILWGDMVFAYDDGSWDPDTHRYSGGWSPLTAEGNDLTVENHSNVALAVSVTFTPDAAFTQYDLTGTFNGIAAGANRIARGGSLATELNLRSLHPDALKDQGTKRIGQITVSLTTIGGE